MRDSVSLGCYSAGHSSGHITGGVDAAEVAQLYAGIPNGPVKQLKGFSKVDVEAGKNFTLELDIT